MTARPARGFSLIELLLAFGLGLAVMAALAGLLAPVVRAQAAEQSDAAARLDSEAALGEAVRLLRQASLISRPAIPGASSSALEGCLNAEASPDSALPTPISAGAPMEGFALCSLKGGLWLHQGAGCPLDYVCGDAPGVLVAGNPGGPARVWASFVLDPGSAPMVSAEITAQVRAAAARAFTRVALTRAAGAPR